MALIFHCVDAAAVRRKEPTRCLGMNLQAKSPGRQRRPDYCHLRIGLCVHLASKAVAGFATHTRSTFVALDGKRERKRFEPLMLEGGRYLFDDGLVRKGGVGITSNIRRFRGIASGPAVHAV